MVKKCCYSIILFLLMLLFFIKPTYANDVVAESKVQNEEAKETVENKDKTNTQNETLSDEEKQARDEQQLQDILDGKITILDILDEENLNSIQFKVERSEKEDPTPKENRTDNIKNALITTVISLVQLLLNNILLIIVLIALLVFRLYLKRKK